MNKLTAKYFSTFDLAKGYRQVPVAREAQAYTTFTSPFGLYQFTVMPFSPSGTPATFQHMMDQLTNSMEGFAAAYLDT